MQNFLDILKERVVLADGAMGSRLFEKGVPASACYDALNVERPSLVAATHDEYLNAGAEIIETNTFGANAFKLEPFGLEDKVREFNLHGARIARQQAGNKAWVAGSMGPLGRLEELPPAKDIQQAYTKQAQALAEGGVDILILETFPRLDVLLTALHAAKSTGLPVIAQMVFALQGGSFSGLRPEECLAALAAAGADVVGINCGLGPLGALEAIKRVGPVDKHLSVFPNAGYPERSGDRLLYTSSPDYFAEKVIECTEVGARLVGGCCGTGPAHIAALSRLLAQKDPSARPAIQVQARLDSEAPTELPVSAFGQKLGTQKMILVELDPPKHMDISQAMEGATALAHAGVDAITVAENPLATPRLSNTVLASAIRRETGAEVIVHMTGRDRNLIGMQSAIMGLAAEGLTNVLAVTGDPPPQGADDVIKGVFDLRSFDLISLLSRFNTGENHHGTPMRIRPNFQIGGAFNPNTKNPAMQVRRMERKMENGASYFLTQPVYTKEAADKVAELTAHINAPIFLGVMPLASSRNAEFLHNEFPGISVPGDIRKRMRDAGDNGMAEGTEIARELINHAIDAFSGVYIMPPFNRYKVALDLMQGLQQDGKWQPSQ